MKVLTGELGICKRLEETSVRLHLASRVKGFKLITKKNGERRADEMGTANLRASNSMQVNSLSPLQIKIHPFSLLQLLGILCRDDELCHPMQPLQCVRKNSSRYHAFHPRTLI